MFAVNFKSLEAARIERLVFKKRKIETEKQAKSEVWKADGSEVEDVLTHGAGASGG